MIVECPDGPGVGVALVDNGKVAFSQGYGLADVETKRPITPDTTFTLASMTKQFTAMAIYLYEELLPVWSIFTVSYDTLVSNDWERRLPTLARERDRLAVRVP
jgi:hypothetical protein